MARISPPNHADAMLVDDPTISLASPGRLSAIRQADRRAYDDTNADDSVEIGKVPCDVVL